VIRAITGKLRVAMYGRIKKWYGGRGAKLLARMKTAGYRLTKEGKRRKMHLCLKTSPTGISPGSLHPTPRAAGPPTAAHIFFGGEIPDAVDALPITLPYAPESKRKTTVFLRKRAAGARPPPSACILRAEQTHLRVWVKCCGGEAACAEAWMRIREPVCRWPPALVS